MIVFVMFLLLWFGGEFVSDGVRGANIPHVGGVLHLWWAVGFAGSLVIDCFGCFVSACGVKVTFGHGSMQFLGAELTRLEADMEKAITQCTDDGESDESRRPSKRPRVSLP